MRRTRRPRPSASSPASWRAGSCSTPARRQGARAWRCVRTCRPAPIWWPTTSGRDGSRCSRRRWRASRGRASRCCAATRDTCRLLARSTRCSSTRRARASARCDGSRTSVGDARRRTCPGSSSCSEPSVEDALRALAPGGRLIYATCSSEPEENETLVSDLLQAHSGLDRMDLRQAGLPAAMAPLLTDEGALRTWPHAHGLDAFYAVVLEKRR